MSTKIIHYNLGFSTPCGAIVDKEKLTHYWTLVTCKSCLKYLNKQKLS